MTKNENSKTKVSSPRFFSASNWLILLLVILIIGLGVGFRMMRLTSPPLDVHAWRWLRSAIGARAMYYEMEPDIDPDLRAQAISLSNTYAHTEPQITEKLVALSYKLVGGEYLWISRIWTTLFWTIAGIAAFLLAEQIASRESAIITLAYFMLLPFANTETLVMLPEPLMVMFIMLALYASNRWLESQSWKWAIASGIFIGLAIYVKVFAFFFLAPALIFVCIATFGFKKALVNRQVWAVGLIAFFIPATYYFFPDPGMGGNYLAVWSIPFLGRLREISFYISWIHRINEYFNLAIVLIALASVSLLEKRWRTFIFGLWLGYLIYGLTFPTLIWSHAYYNLPMVGIVALSLAPLAKLFLNRITKEGKFWQFLVLTACLVAVGYSVFMSRKAIYANDYREEEAKWVQISEIISGYKVIGFTEDNNMRLAYFGNRVIKDYPYYYDYVMASYLGKTFDFNADNQGLFDQMVDGQDLFIVTNFEELNLQPYVKRILNEQYSVFDQSDWYIIYDLNQPLN